MGKKFKKFKKTIELNGESLQEYINQLDNRLLTNDRLQLVRDLLIVESSENEYGKLEIVNDFLLEALTMKVEGKQIVDVSLTTASNLSDEDTFFIQMQRFANYILYAPDSERITKKVKYNFYPEKQFRAKINKDKPMSEFKNDDDADIEVIDFLVGRQVNYKFSKSFEKLPTGWKNDAELEPLLHYEKLIKIIQKKNDKLLNILKNNKELDKNEKFEISKEIRRNNTFKKSMMIDQLDLYEIIKKPIYLKQPMADSTSVDWTEFDFSNPSHVRALLYLPKDKSYIDYRDSLVSDMYRYVRNCKFNESQLMILDLLPKGYTLEKIGDAVCMKPTTVVDRISEIVDGIVYAYLVDAENYKYTFNERGTYTQCKVCGKNILVSEYRQNDYCDVCVDIKPTKLCKKCGCQKPVDEFSVDNSKKDLLKSNCKSCEKERLDKYKLDKMLKSAGIL